VVGDSLVTDVATAHRCAIVSALVLTGVTDRARLEVADPRPDFVLESIADLREL
jgi:ribonucleotide monophosphatase NagD (HAD superfamily)